MLTVSKVLTWDRELGGHYKVESNQIIFGLGSSNDNNEPHWAFKFDTGDRETIGLQLSGASRPYREAEHLLG